MKKALIFDFDYTLGDSTDGIVISVNYALKELGYPERATEEVKRTVGLTLKQTCEIFTKKQDEAEAQKFAELFKEKADEVILPNTTLYPGVMDILQKLKRQGIKTGIVTTKYHYRIDAILNKFNAGGLVDIIVGGDDVKVEKPDPEGLLLAAGELELEKNEVLYVGDSLVDARTAENAGIDFAGVLTGTTTKQDFENYKSEYIGKNIEDIYHFAKSLI